ncbi:MAG: hypothetical protein AB1894_02670 [Chloroflexota bacterium]
MKNSFTANTTDGPRLFSFRDGLYFYGAYHNLEFTEQDRGKTLTVSVDSHQLSLCWIELWPAHYDGKDWVKWTTDRGQDALALTGHKPHPNPQLTWKIEPGKYSIYFVNSSPTDKIKHQIIAYQIEIK